MEHYVVILDWSTESECDVDIIGVAHSMEEAKELFKQQLVTEKEITEREGWDTFEETEDFYEAYEYGSYNDGHSRLWIQGVN